MLSKVLWKCFIVICLCFLMCPKRVRVRKLKKKLDGPLENKISKLSLESDQYDRANPKPDGRADADEAGFDLTEDEMAKFKIWPQGIIPYYIDDFSFDKVYRDRFRNFLEAAGGTGLQFFELPKPLEDNNRWVFFINRRGVLECYDYTTNDFTNDGVQRVVLGYDCLDRERALAGTVLALAGVPPQHNAPDRDKYVQVNIENVLPDKQDLFKALGNDEWLFHDVEYDYNSAGHFDWHKYSANGKATISPTQKVNEDDAEQSSFTSSDLEKIRMLYNYISKHPKLGTAKIAECNQLFVPGAKFANYEPDSEETVKPRSKPNKYLGISENFKISTAPDQDTNEQDNNNGTNNNSEKVKNNEESTEIVEKNEENDSNENATTQGIIEVQNQEDDNEQDSKMETDNKEDSLNIQNDVPENKEDIKGNVEENKENDGGEDDVVLEGSEDVTQQLNTLKLIGYQKSPIKVTQAHIFDLSDYDTKEKWAKLKQSLK